MNRSCLCPNAIACLVLLAFSGCAEEPGPPPAPTKTASAQKTDPVSEKNDTAIGTSEKQAFSGLKFFVPDAWSEVPLSERQMGIIAAEFFLGDDAANCTLTLSRSGGGMESNLNRWRGQFASSRPEIVETISVAGIEATQIDLEGDFSPGMGRPNQADARMLGVIVPMVPQDYFIKLTGPASEVSGVEEDFRDFVNSASKE